MKFGVIGTGFGATLIEKLLKLDVDISAVYGHKNRERLPRLPYVEDPMQVLDMCDVVVIASPVQCHAEQIIAAATRELAIYVEKPTVASVDEMAAVAAAVNLTGNVFMTGHPFCYSDDVVELSKTEWIFASATVFRGPINQGLNPYWHIGVHYVAIFDLLGLRDFGVELFGHQAFDGTLARVRVRLWDSNMQERFWATSGDIMLNEMSHFVQCARTGAEPRTGLSHSERVLKTLAERYGKCLI